MPKMFILGPVFTTMFAAGYRTLYYHEFIHASTQINFSFSQPILSERLGKLNVCMHI